MTKEEWLDKNPLQLRFCDWGEVWKSFGKPEKVVAVITSPFTISFFITYSLLNELQFHARSRNS